MQASNPYTGGVCHTNYTSTREEVKRMLDPQMLDQVAHLIEAVAALIASLRRY